MRSLPHLTRYLLTLVLLCLCASAALAQPTGKAAKGRRRYAFAQKDEESPYVKNITKNTGEEEDVDGSFTRLGYRTYTEMVAELTHLKKLHDWADTTYQRRVGTVPPGGVLTVIIHRQGPKNADLGNLAITVTDKTGKEVFTHTPPTSTGRFFGRDLYQAKAVIPFPSLAPQELNVSIRDAKLYQTFDYALEIPAAQ